MYNIILHKWGRGGIKKYFGEFFFPIFCNVTYIHTYRKYNALKQVSIHNLKDRKRILVIYNTLDTKPMKKKIFFYSCCFFF